MHTIGKLVLVALFALGLEGCATSVMTYDEPMSPEAGPAIVDNGTLLQCVPYAREQSGIEIYGDAYTWWDKAAGKYPRGPLPEPGTVMVLHNYAGPARGHLAVVRQVIGPREIRVDHANWLNDGSIYVNDPVQDVSGDNDWSLVRVFNLKAGAWGSRLYPVQGFIGAWGRPQQDRPDLTADRGGSARGASALVGEIY
ncbi:MAG TPA: CHAP domain-containing protein [Rhizomicrobium sp.]|nr:CHAP domain-containing protein [Rhizomicrobium sp.]